MVSFALAIFLSAFLLFQVQPLMGKAILPLFGGGAGVWTACMLFFQAGLLGGYTYAHVITEKLRPSVQVIVHLSLLGASLLLLPIGAVDESWRSDSVDTPTLHILLLLAIKIGPPYLLLSATGPLLQSWFSQTFGSKSPYRLYSLSNFGSLLALISYPFLFERVFTVRVQGWAWSIGFVLFVLVCGWCGKQFSKVAGVMQATDGGQGGPTAKKTDASGDAVTKPAAAPGIGRIVLWISLAAVGSLMLLATTNQLCQDLTVVPMLWIAPLAVYLITFIICFDHDRWYNRIFFIPLIAVSILAVNWMLHDIRSVPINLQLGIYVVAMFAACMVCHGELVRSKPAPKYLTSFYLYISAGGALGGLIAAVVAPLIFLDYWEYQLTWALVSLLAVICLLRSYQPKMSQRQARLAWMSGLGVAIALSGSLGFQIYIKKSQDLETSRSFYGVLHVTEETDHLQGPVRHLIHGQTLHGIQFLAPEKVDWPTTYYGHRSGVAIAIDHMANQRRGEGGQKGLRIGVVGLGVGTIAALAREDDTMRFYEINKDVERVARSHFSYLERCQGKVEMVIGDARLLLDLERRQEQFEKFDVLAIDAFSSDAIPLHLITQEAFDIYHDHLKPDGIIAFHISNKFMDLNPVVRGISSSKDYQVRTIISKEEHLLFGTQRSVWAMVTRNGELWKSQHFALSINPLERSPKPNLAWTDDSANLISIISTNTHHVGRWTGPPIAAPS